MSETLKKSAATNTTPGSVCKIDAGCDTTWSKAQQFAIRRLTNRYLFGAVTIPPRRGILVDYVERAKLIAGTYVRFYLELEEHGDPAKKGRYYWMALGAFASKTVACSLDKVTVQATRLASAWIKADPVRHKLTPEQADPGYPREKLGQGNFWLFQDIAPLHWYYSAYPGSFFQCLPTRGVDGCHKQVADNLRNLVWADQSLPILKNLQASGFVENGFKLVKEFEVTTASKRKPTIQLEHLMEIAKHEQGDILQPLIYDDPGFATWMKLMREKMPKWLVPPFELVFTHACETDDPKLKSEAPNDLVVENYDSRMYWITNAANQFHGLMQNQTAFMESELKKMADWTLAKAREDLQP